MLRFLKRNSILLAFLAIYVLLLALVLIELDKQNFQNRKRELILEDPQRYVYGSISDPLLTQIRTEAGRAVVMGSAAERQAVASLIRPILDAENNIYRVTILGPHGSIAAAAADAAGTADSPPAGVHYFLDESNPDKFRRHNTFANSLFARDFSGPVSIDLGDTGDSGRLTLYYTTPLDAPAIDELTIRYRWYAGFIVVALSLLAWLVARALLLPLRQVTIAFENSASSHIAFVPRPRSRIETLYNRMALGAVVARLHGRLRDLVARQPKITAWEVVERICHEVREEVALPLVAAMEIAVEGPGHMRATGARVVAGDPDVAAAADDLARLLDQAMPRDGRSEAIVPWMAFAPPLDVALRLVADRNRVGIRYLFAVALPPGGAELGRASRHSMVESLVDLAESGLQTLSLRNQLLVQERGRANISLSRNLGHDLTNIIAASKLDLLALDRLLRDGRAPQDEARRAMLAEALQSLMQSVRFMQETVNLYRAYAFMQHPVLETHDGNALVGDTLDLFMMSVSGKVRVVRELALDAPRCTVDPRLVKLALFNMFVNAIEAIRRGEAERVAQGWIKVTTGRSPEGGLTIAVEDSGPGILTPDGARAAPHEIEKIFDLGYSSQGSAAPHKEGLGLNWVRTIVHDLHGGAIRAENAAEGGARFILTFPPLEAATPPPATELSGRA